MFNELYGLVNRNIKYIIESDHSIPDTKRGALIAETTTGILHVMNGLNTTQRNESPWKCSFDNEFNARSEHQLQWRFMIHLGLEEKQSGRIIHEILPLLTPALQKHYQDTKEGLYS